MAVNRITDVTKVYQAAQKKDAARGFYRKSEDGLYSVAGGVATKGVIQGFHNQQNFFGGKNYNPLHEFNSYNYIFTLSSLSADQARDPDSYKDVIGTSVESDKHYIVLRSGGYKRKEKNFTAVAIPNISATEVPAYDFPEATQGNDSLKGLNSGNVKSNHNRDLFIDNVQFKTVMGLGGAGVSNLTTGSFEVIEPHSVAGFYEELYAASVFGGHQDYLGAPFLLTVQFVGHRVEGDDVITQVVPRTTRHFPIIIQGSSMNVTEAGARYSVKFAGMNYVGGTASTSLIDDINSPSEQEDPTVSSVLHYLFKEYNGLLEAQMRAAFGDKGNSDIKTPNKIQQKYKGKKIAPFQPHKFTIKFVTKDEPWKIAGHAYTSWEGLADGFIKGGPTGNVIGDSKMKTGELPYSGFYAFDKYDKQAEQSDKDIEDEKKFLSDSIKDLAKQVEQLDKDAAKIREELKPFYNVTDEELAAVVPNYDPKKEGGPPGTVTVSKAKEIDWTMWDDVANKQVDTGDTPVGIASGNPSQKKKDEIDELIRKYNEKINSAEFTRSEMEIIKTNIKNLKEAKGTIYTKSYRRFGKGAQQWQFKKGTTLADNIHNILLDSDYAMNLTNPTKEKEYKNTGYFDWYKIDIIPELIGYDTAINKEVYTYHFLIFPYRMHVSQFPGIKNVGYNYDKLKQESVREYNYIYTGKNLDVLKFNLDFDNLFTATPMMFNQSETAPGQTGTDSETTSQSAYPENILEAVQQNRVATPKSTYANQKNNTSDVGVRPTNRTQVAKALHDSLYNNPGAKALLKAELGIVGDPVYLLSANINSKAVMEADEIETEQGEANAFTREANVVFNFGTALDYPNQEEVKEGEAAMKLIPSYYSGVYQVTTVENSFNEGVFTQDLTIIRKPNQENDYIEKRTGENIVVEVVDPRLGAASQENQDKMKKTPAVSASAADLEKSKKYVSDPASAITESAGLTLTGAVGSFTDAVGGAFDAIVSTGKDLLSGATAYTPEQLQKNVETQAQSNIKVSTTKADPYAGTPFEGAPPSLLGRKMADEERAEFESALRIAGINRGENR